jgi:hypothetical protein
MEGSMRTKPIVPSEIVSCLTGTYNSLIAEFGR